MPSTCPFCVIKDEDYILENQTTFVIFDCFPVSKGHMLFIPKRHVVDVFGLTEQEIQDLFALVQEGKKLLDQKFAPQGYNFGFNAGVVAGQSVMHCHGHLIPRYQGDVVDPRGGVRGVISAKKNY